MVFEPERGIEPLTYALREGHASFGSARASPVALKHMLAIRGQRWMEVEKWGRERDAEIR